MSNWQHHIKAAPDNGYQIHRRENHDNVFIGLDDAVLEIFRICSFPGYFEMIQPHILQETFRQQLGKVWQQISQQPGVVVSNQKEIRYHVVMPALINYLNSQDRRMQAVAASFL